MAGARGRRADTFTAPGWLRGCFPPVRLRDGAARGREARDCEATSGDAAGRGASRRKGRAGRSMGRALSAELSSSGKAAAPGPGNAPGRCWGEDLHPRGEGRLPGGLDAARGRRAEASVASDAGTRCFRSNLEKVVPGRARGGLRNSSPRLEAERLGDAVCLCRLSQGSRVPGGTWIHPALKVSFFWLGLV